MNRVSRLYARLRRGDLAAAVARGASIAIVIRVLGIGLGYVSEVILARLLGPSDYGVYSLVIAWITLLALVPPLGMHHAVVRFIPEYIARGDGGRLRGVIRSSLLLTTGLSLALAALGLLALYWLSQVVAIPHLMAWYVGLWMLPLFAMLRLLWGMAIALRQVITALAPGLILEPILIVALAVALMASGQPAVAVMVLAAAAITRVIELVIQAIAMRRQGLPVAADRALYEARTWMLVGLPLLLFDAFSVILRQADVLMVGALMTPADVGMYGAALKTTGQVVFLMATVNIVVTPMLSSLYTQGDVKALQRLLYLAAHLSFWPALLVVVGLSVFAAPILRLFGPDFVAAQGPLIVLGLGQLVNASTGVVVGLLIVTGHHIRVTVVFAWSALLYLILTYLGIRFFGLMGAALSTAMTMSLWNIWLHRWTVKRLGLRTSIVSALRYQPLRRGSV